MDRQRQKLQNFAHLASVSGEWEEWRHRPPHFQLRTQALLAELFVTAARHATPQDYEGTPLRTDAPRRAAIVRRLLAYLDEHSGRPITAGQVQRELGYSYAYVCRLFREATGMRIRAYLHRQRIGRARHLLLDPERRYGIAEVAETVGYTDPCYFSRVFRQEQGCSPRQYVARAYAA